MLERRLRFSITWGDLVLWVIAAAALIAVFAMDARAEVPVTLAWDAYTAPADYSHAQLMQSELEPGTPPTWTEWHEIDRPDHEALKVVIEDVPDGTYRWQLWAVDTGGLTAVGDTVAEDINGPPPAFENFRIITMSIVTIKGGQIVSQVVDSSIKPLLDD